MVKPTVFKMGTGRKWWWHLILTQLVAALQKKKPVDIALFSVRAIRPAGDLNFLQINSQRPFSFGCFSEWAPGPSPSVQNQQL